MALTLWHNPRCSKSRQALKLLEEAGQTPLLRLYLNEPPTFEELSDLLENKDQGLKDATEAELLTAMIENPILIERPIAVNQDRAAIGRPPEDVLDII